jgi:hypothetical protein
LATKEKKNAKQSLISVVKPEGYQKTKLAMKMKSPSPDEIFFFFFGLQFYFEKVPNNMKT